MVALIEPAARSDWSKVSKNMAAPHNTHLRSWRYRTYQKIRAPEDVEMILSVLADTLELDKVLKDRGPHQFRMELIWCEHNAWDLWDNRAPQRHRSPYGYLYISSESRVKYITIIIYQCRPSEPFWLVWDIPLKDDCQVCCLSNTVEYIPSIKDILASLSRSPGNFFSTAWRKYMFCTSWSVMTTKTGTTRLTIS